jgi:FtsH-binding integral membrane protein
MSNYDRDAAVPDHRIDRAIAIDAGLRAHMLRVYNYMAISVGLTGCVAMLTYQLTGPALLQSPLMWVFILAPLGLVFFIGARINTLSVEMARLLLFVYAALVEVSLSTIFHVYTALRLRVYFSFPPLPSERSAFGAIPPNVTYRDLARSC